MKRKMPHEGTLRLRSGRFVKARHAEVWQSSLITSPRQSDPREIRLQTFVDPSNLFQDPFFCSYARICMRSIPSIRKPLLD